jgi:RNA polymerase sigma-70 factor, ECF subfamily
VSKAPDSPLLDAATVAPLFRLAFRLLGTEAEARECVQDALIRAHERADQFRGDAAHGTWLHKICVSIALNRLRARKRKEAREVSLDDPDNAPAVPANSAPESDPYLRARLFNAIDALPDGYRTVFLMFDVEGYAHEEIAERLGVSVGTTKAQLFRARAKLREALGDVYDRTT